MPGRTLWGHSRRPPPESWPHASACAWALTVPAAWVRCAVGPGTTVGSHGPTYWRKYYKPTIARVIELCHSHDLPVFYHGCGKATGYLEDMIEIGLDAYDPLEAKADQDVNEVRELLGPRLTLTGNSDIRVWERGDPEELRREVLHRLRAATDGGYVFMSDHSVPTDVSGKTYDTIVKLVRQYGDYPLHLPEA